ncbi:hypothetical protein M1L60_02725 [Actinoplanes sp. TRM 88003]|uniref:Uncharacterized protein n=1 Tax=Paractinoplanes aksuensis TaxID=2939490 RepID=A0ABT1DFA2_9ACTN|nr:hypothetical protein [Actinoplanes aksuensis]MCO8269502.1 hypothetical protein [Actinoplanes aksuensis]
MGRHSRRPQHRLWRRLRWYAAATALAAAAAHLYPANARFTDTTSNTGNTVSSGTVVLSGTVPLGGQLFTVPNAIPGSTAIACVITTYTGTLPATVQMYVPSVTGTLGSYMVFRLQIGTGSNTDCSDFNPTSTLYNTSGMRAASQTLDAFIGAHNTWATGVGNWSATTNTTRTWKLEWIVQSNDAAQSQSTSFTARWEAQR